MAKGDLITVFRGRGEKVGAGKMTEAELEKDKRTRLPGLRSVRRNVYRKFHELPCGNNRRCPARKRHNTSGFIRACASGQKKQGCR